MTLRHLRIFVEVCDRGGVTRAAEALHVSQPVVSTALSELEGYYGVRLFDRINQRLIITDEGRLLCLKAKEVLSAFDDFESLAREGGEHPTVRVGSSLTIAKDRLPALLARIGEKFPSVDLRIEVGATHDIEKRLADGNLDFALVEGRVTLPGIVAHPLYSDRLIAVCAADSDLPTRGDVAWLASQRLLLREPGSASRDALDRLFAAAKLSPEPVMTSVSNSALMAACAAGFGIAVLPEGIARAQLGASLREIELTDADLTRGSFLIIHKNKRLGALQTELKDTCVKLLSSEPDGK